MTNVNGGFKGKDKKVANDILTEGSRRIPTRTDSRKKAGNEPRRNRFLGGGEFLGYVSHFKHRR